MIIAWLGQIELRFVVYGANSIATNWRLRDASTFQNRFAPELRTHVIGSTG
jgi:hypothetical protein